MKLSLLKRWSGTLAQIEEKHPSPGLHVYFAKEQQTAKLGGMLMGKRLGGMTERRQNSAADTLPPFATAFIDRSFEFVERGYLTRINVLYTGKMNNGLYDYRGRACVESELVRLQSKIYKFKIVSEKRFALHCSFGLFTLEYRFLDLVLDVLS